MMPTSLSGTLRLGLAVFLVGCGSAASDAPAPPTVTALASPAGEGSGEPFLSSAGDAVWMSWLEELPADAGHALRVSRFEEGAWSPPLQVAAGDRFFVNWADFPSVVADPEGRLWAHWLERGDAGGYDYGIRVVHSDDQGATWSAPWTPHEDGTPQEHGFVTIRPTGSGVGLVWLDGRRYAGWPAGTEPSREMTLRYRTTRGDPSTAGPEVLLDDRACDCCQTDAAVAGDGLVVVYRDRSPDEIRDIAVVRQVDGAWTEPAIVHADGWEIAGCPVNGPAIVARGDAVAVAWFTGAGDVPRVKVAFSEDGGATFGPPVVVDGGNPAGRVDLLQLQGGAVLVGWLERRAGDGAEVRVRRVAPDGTLDEPQVVAASDAARGSGFPRFALRADGTVLAAWTDIEDGGTSRVRTALLQEIEP
ncbi:MAG: sialidase family protein [Longimicrobiales bacterium]